MVTARGTGTRHDAAGHGGYDGPAQGSAALRTQERINPAEPQAPPPSAISSRHRPFRACWSEASGHALSPKLARVSPGIDAHQQDIGLISDWRVTNALAGPYPGRHAQRYRLEEEQAER